MADNETKKEKSIFSLKNIFFIIIIFSIAQPLFINLKKQITETIHPNTYVGYLKLTGMITDSSYFVKQIHKFAKNETVKGLLIKINSQGGLPGSSEAIFNELKKFKEKKPVIVMISDMAASGGYYVAAAGDKIVSNAGALVGSIGSFMFLPNVKRLLNNYNVNVDLVAAGKYKVVTSPVTDRTPAEIAYLKNVINDSYEIFAKDIAQARGFDINKKEVWADGKIFTGNQALKLNLVDKIGSMTVAKETMREVLTERKMKVEGKIKFIEPKRITGLARMFYGEEDSMTDVSMSSRLGGFLHSTYKEFINLESKPRIEL